MKNPYRYRGYRYDTETGLYYLQSRYYNPEWGRFINADGMVGATGELLSHNMFAYCKNSPIELSDEEGFRPLYCADPNEETDEERESSLACISSASKTMVLYKEHTKGTRESTKGVHEKGQTRRQRDAEGEKGDARRKPNPNKRRDSNKCSITNIDWRPVIGIGIITVASITAIIIVADDVTGGGIADDSLKPLN